MDQNGGPYNKDERERAAAPLTAARHDRGLSTEIGPQNRCGRERTLHKKRRRLARMRRELTRGRWRSKAERNPAHELGEVRRLASALDLSETLCDQACQLFRSAQQENLLRGRSIEAIAAASVYGACRCNGRSQFLDDITAVATVGESRVTNAYRILNEELGLLAIPATPAMYISRLASDIDCSDRVRRRARVLLKTAEDAGVATAFIPPASPRPASTRLDRSRVVG